MRSIKDALWRLFHLIVGAYACMLLLGALYAQTAPLYQVNELERRVLTLEGLGIDHRLTVIETLLQELRDGTLWNRLNMGGTGLLIGERVVSAVRKKKPEDA